MWHSGIMARMKRWVEKLEVPSEPGLTNTQLMLTNHDLRPGENTAPTVDFFRGAPVLPYPSPFTLPFSERRFPVVEQSQLTVCQFDLLFV